MEFDERIVTLEVTMEIFCGLKSSGHSHESIGTMIRMIRDRLQCTMTTFAMLTRTYQRNVGRWWGSETNGQGNLVLLRNLFVLRRLHSFLCHQIFFLVVSKSRRSRWIALFLDLNRNQQGNDRRNVVLVLLCVLQGEKILLRSVPGQRPRNSLVAATNLRLKTVHLGLE